MFPTNLVSRVFLLFITLSTVVSPQSLPDNMIIGTDGPADPATKGYYIYQTGLNVRDLNASKHFYGDILGMRTMLTIQYTPSFSLTYMGFAQGGRNGTGFQTGAELLREKNNSGGMVKLLHFSNAKSSALDTENGTLVPSTRRTNTFSNLGLVVPDIAAAQARMDAFGVRTVKRLGETTSAFDSALANATNTEPAATDDRGEAGRLVEALGSTDFGNIIFVLDPDGNLLEVVGRDGV
ncbi:hypothetical protein BJY00DRAFT_318220 [Aspergillus carlsbadensis]|nr:hypothetical protein BJY00DRAFT_318220 [Aspergillus carlsbadensis]